MIDDNVVQKRPSLNLLVIYIVRREIKSIPKARGLPMVKQLVYTVI